MAESLVYVKAIRLYEMKLGYSELWNSTGNSDDRLVEMMTQAIDDRFDTNIIVFEKKKEIMGKYIEKLNGKIKELNK